MNHIYKVVWSKTKHCYVVASEFAKASGKSAGKKAVVGAALAAIALTGAGTPVEAASASIKAGEGTHVEQINSPGYRETYKVSLDPNTQKTLASVADKADSSTVDELSTKVANNTSAIDAEKTAREAADTALDARVSTNEAAIGGLEKNLELQDQVNDQQQLDIYANKTAIETNEKLIAQEIADREAADTAINEKIQNISATEGSTTVTGDFTAQSGTSKVVVDAGYAGIAVGNQSVAVIDGLGTVISGDTSIKGNVSVTGTVNAAEVDADDVSAADVTVSNDLTVVGNTTLTDAAVTGTLSVGEIDNVETAITDNAAAIKAETQARAEADENLQKNINNEAVLRDQADQNLQKNINNEATLRDQADQNLQKNINNEATLRDQADQNLQTNINNEAASRAAADKQLSSKIDSVDSNSKKGIAGVAALAALHPLDFDPDAKWDFAAGYGNYRGENAAAIGAYYRPNEDIMFSVGGTLGNSDNNSVNAGLSLKIGAGSSHVNNSKTAMAKEIKDLRAIVEKQDAQIQKMAAMFNSLAGIDALTVDQSKLFPDVPENHWAYEAVDAMAKTGLIEGYPDGEFKGDRLLTRYEFAQVVYRAIQKGAEIDSRLVSEFEPELKYFHIDAVHHDKDGNATVERVRVNK